MSEDISGVTKVSNKEDKVEEETIEEDTIDEESVVEKQSIEPDRPSNDDDIDSFFG